ncbi:MAG: serine hydrolase, partial [Candidatus Saccharibacteria bacterium]|nr:serine hydrolase [Candidatus Saccharibacteria bacterium]
STGKSILKCLDLAIRESNSPCAETLWGMIGHAELDQIIRNDFGILNSNISNLSSNPNDIAKIMQRFYEHPDIQDPELVALMFDSFLNQPKTSYDWRRGLPSGFSEDVKVYNKVGWDWSGSYWKVYHDAAIVDFSSYGRSFIVVVMTSKIKHQEIGEFAKMLEAEFLDQI